MIKENEKINTIEFVSVILSIIFISWFSYNLIRKYDLSLHELNGWEFLVLALMFGGALILFKDIIEWILIRMFAIREKRIEFLINEDLYKRLKVRALKRTEEEQKEGPRGQYDKSIFEEEVNKAIRKGLKKKNQNRREK